MDKQRLLLVQNIYIFGLVILLSSGLWCYAAGETTIGARVVETILPNGLKVLLLENHKAPLVSFQVWYRVGSRHEAWGKTGLSHMLEHMMFKGTETMGPEVFAKRIEQHGGHSNAFTTRDFTAYFENLSADQVGVALTLEADRMQHLALRQQDFHTERQVVMEERRLRIEDNPTAFLQEQMTATAFQASPYHWPVIGWMDDIAQLTLDDLTAHYHTYYSPSNAFIVAVGDFQAAELLSHIVEIFGMLPKGTTPTPPHNHEPSQPGERRLLVKKEAQLPFIMMGYHVPNIHDADSYVLEVIAALLAEGQSSRLYRGLVDEAPLALDVDADYALLAHEPDLFSITVTPLPGRETAEIERAVDHELMRLQQEPVAAHDLDKAKNQLEATFIFSQDSLFYQAMLLAQYEIVSSWKDIDHYVPAIRHVSAADVQRVAGQYLVPDNRTVGILVPLPFKDGKAAETDRTTPERLLR